MSLLGILFSLAIEHYYSAVEKFRIYDWVSSFSDWVKEKFSVTEIWNDTLGVIATILIPMFACALIYGLLSEAMGLLGFLFSLLVLVYCIGPKRFIHTARLYIDAGEHEDEHSLKSYANELLETDDSEINNETHQKVCEKLIINTNEGILSIFFWFILLGPMGALMCRMVNVLYTESLQQISDNDDNNDNENIANEDDGKTNFTEFNSSIRTLYAILLWLPAQITMLTFAITGSFIDSLREWKSRLSNDYLNPKESEETLFRTGMNALQIDPDSHQYEISTVHEVYALCWRSVIVWVTALALLTLAGLTG
jgi:membrane protein required for beta-lactamase induction